ncbi:class II glutamine amidotransferase [Mobiluncus mulieris FB024-16]|nr:class II glutamine amidotransferase [Mobiluncus mulieris FB024-16]
MAFEFGALEVAAGVSLPELPVSSVGSKPGLTGLKPGLPRETPCEVPGADSLINPRVATEGTQLGKSTTNLDEPWNPGATPEDDYPREECGVFGVWAPGEDVSRLAYFGLYALQHRGQESAGIATSDGSKILVFKDMGLVSQVFSDRDLATLTGHIAVGHVRYATAGASSWCNAQPTLGPTAFGTLALAHNGNLVNARELAARVGVAAASRAGSLGASGECGETRDSGMAPRENETTGNEPRYPKIQLPTRCC